jgi:hypothetical protein
MHALYRKAKDWSMAKCMSNSFSITHMEMRCVVSLIIFVKQGHQDTVKHTDSWHGFSVVQFLRD